MHETHPNYDWVGRLADDGCPHPRPGDGHVPVVRRATRGRPVRVTVDASWAAGRYSAAAVIGGRRTLRTRGRCADQNVAELLAVRLGIAGCYDLPDGAGVSLYTDSRAAVFALLNIDRVRGGEREWVAKMILADPELRRLRVGIYWMRRAKNGDAHAAAAKFGRGGQRGRP